MQTTEKQPGPNDHHIDEDGRLQPGLGKDEPSAQEKLRAKANGSAKLDELKAELASVSEKLERKQQTLEDRERALAAREAALAAAEQKAKK